MEIVPSEASLVVAGAWNVAILTPDWVLRNGLRREGGEQVQVTFPAGPGAVFEFPRYQLRDLTYVVRPDSLVVVPSSLQDEAIVHAENAVARMVEVLKHTPVSGVGHNFEFRDPAPDPRHLSVFSASRQDIGDELDEQWSSAAVNLMTSFSRANGKVVVNIQRSFDAGQISVKFNFHHPVSGTVEALSVLSAEGDYWSMKQSREFSMALIEKLYGRQ